MPMEVQYKEGIGYLIVKVCGQWELGEAKQEMEALRDEANKRGHTRILVDVRDMSPQKSDLSRYYTGEYIAKILPYPFRVAAIDTPEFINRFVENVAVNRGAFFAAFAQEKAAIEWLMKGTNIGEADQ
jgi:hypothetical protein